MRIDEGLVPQPIFGKAAKNFWSLKRIRFTNNSCINLRKDQTVSSPKYFLSPVEVCG